MNLHSLISSEGKKSWGGENIECREVVEEKSPSLASLADAEHSSVEGALLSDGALRASRLPAADTVSVLC